MRWKGRRQSDNLEDRRGQGGGGGLFRFPMGGWKRSPARGRNGDYRHNRCGWHHDISSLNLVK